MCEGEMIRKKTTVELPLEIHNRIKEWGQRSGVGMNGFLSMASVHFMAHLSKIDTRQKRSKIMKDLKADFQRLLTEAEDAL